MIFITVGSQKFQFNRLLEAVDRIVADGAVSDRVFAQTGYSDYKPVNYEFREFLTREEFAEEMARASLVITHGGTGAIIGAVKNGKKVIAVPRLARYGEHVDDHQLQLISQFREMKLICECPDPENLLEKIEEAKNTVYEKYTSNTHRIIESIENYINN